MTMEADLKKLEFMAAVKLVPPAVLEEINRRQRLCKVELGSWWEREHGKQDFCLVLRDSGNCGLTEIFDKSIFGPVETVEIREVSTDYNPVMSTTIATSEYTGLPSQERETSHHISDNNALYQSQS